MKKYRCYTFFGVSGHHFKITYLKKLPKGVRKPVKKFNVWVREFETFLWIKVCRIDSDYHFGTHTT